MVSILTPQQIVEKEGLFKEGLYWEALELPRNASMRDIVISIAELSHAANGDHEFISLLHCARMHFAAGNYPAARAIWDKLRPQLCDAHLKPVLNIDEEKFTRQTIWQDDFGDSLDGSWQEVDRKIRARLTERFRAVAVEMGNKAQEWANEYKIDLATAIKAVDKSIYYLKLARVYTDNAPKTDQDLSTASKVANMLRKAALSRGIPVPIWPDTPVMPPPFLQPTVQQKPTSTPGEPPKPGPVPSPREKPKPVSVPSITRQPTMVSYDIIGSPKVNPGSLVTFGYAIKNPSSSSQSIGLGASLKSPEGSSINDAAHDIIVSISPGTSMYTRAFRIPASISPGKYDVIWGIWSGKPGLSDAYSTANCHQCLSIIAAKPSTAPQPTPPPKSKPAPTTTIPKQSPYKPPQPTTPKAHSFSPKKWGTALALSFFLGHFGADRFYLGRASGVPKLLLFVAWFILVAVNGPVALSVLTFLAYGMWWLVDVVLIGGRWLKDCKGLRLR